MEQIAAVITFWTFTPILAVILARYALKHTRD